MEEHASYQARPASSGVRIGANGDALQLKARRLSAELANIKGPSQVGGEVARLTEVLQECQKALTCLEERLAPILRPGPDEAEAREGEPGVVPLAQEVRSARYVAEDVLRRAQNMLALLEL